MYGCLGVLGLVRIPVCRSRHFVGTYLVGLSYYRIFVVMRTGVVIFLVLGATGLLFVGPSVGFRFGVPVGHVFHDCVGPTF